MTTPKPQQATPKSLHIFLAGIFGSIFISSICAYIISSIYYAVYPKFLDDISIFLITFIAIISGLFQWLPIYRIVIRTSATYRVGVAVGAVVGGIISIGVSIVFFIGYIHSIKDLKILIEGGNISANIVGGIFTGFIMAYMIRKARQGSNGESVLQDENTATPQEQPVSKKRIPWGWLLIGSGGLVIVIVPLTLRLMAPKREPMFSALGTSTVQPPTVSPTLKATPVATPQPTLMPTPTMLSTETPVIAAEPWIGTWREDGDTPRMLAFRSDGTADLVLPALTHIAAQYKITDGKLSITTANEGKSDIGKIEVQGDQLFWTANGNRSRYSRMDSDGSNYSVRILGLWDAPGEKYTRMQLNFSFIGDYNLWPIAVTKGVPPQLVAGTYHWLDPHTIIIAANEIKLLEKKQEFKPLFGVMKVKIEGKQLSLTNVDTGETFIFTQNKSWNAL